MDDLLCEFSKRLPDVVGEFLDREIGRKRNFREETITDLIVASMTAFEPFGVKVDFPMDESKTGEDMDWEFVDTTAENPKNWKYLRLHIQAKRARLSVRKTPYWYYRELDHAVPKGAKQGSQHGLLLNGAKVPGCVPLYMFYHPAGACADLASSVPQISGVNWMFARQIKRKLTKSRWPAKERKVQTLGGKFYKLSDLLCFGYGPAFDAFSSHDTMKYLQTSLGAPAGPDEIASNLNKLQPQQLRGGTGEIRAVNEIPPATLNAIFEPADSTVRDDLKRPRVIFHKGSLG